VHAPSGSSSATPELLPSPPATIHRQRRGDVAAAPPVPLGGGACTRGWARCRQAAQRRRSSLPAAATAGDCRRWRRGGPTAPVLSRRRAQGPGR
jgi:hypothetical protein